MSSATGVLRRALLALAVGGAVTSLQWLADNIAAHSFWAYMVSLLLTPAALLAAVLGIHLHRYSVALANVIIYGGGTYIILWSNKKRRLRPRVQKERGFIDEILTQERPPIFTGVSVAASFVVLGFMALFYARWHGNLQFASLGVPPIYALVALVGVAANIVFGSIAAARGELYSGRIAIASGCMCVLAAFGFVLRTAS